MEQSTKAFAVKYEAGHSSLEEWSKTDHYCPTCGNKSVWQDTSGGDYYVGAQLICMTPKCEVAFYLPNGVTKPDDVDWQAKQRLSELTKS